MEEREWKQEPEQAATLHQDADDFVLASARQKAENMFGTRNNQPHAPPKASKQLRLQV
jgi:hypothetical protein